MARDYTGSTDRLTGPATQPPSIGSLAVRVYPNWAQADGLDHIFISQTTAGYAGSFELRKFSDDSLYGGWYNAGTNYRVIVASANYTLNQSAWNDFILTWDGTAQEVKLYLNGSQIGSTFTTLVEPDVTSAARTIGNYAAVFGANAVADARIAEYGMWSAVLSADDIKAYHLAFSPLLIQRSTLIEYLSLFGRGATERDLFQATSWTVSGGAVIEHPSMIYTARSRVSTVAPTALKRFVLIPS